MQLGIGRKLTFCVVSRMRWSGLPQGATTGSTAAHGTAKNDLHRMNLGYPYPEENYLVRRHSATSWEPFTPTGKENEHGN